MIHNNFNSFTDEELLRLIDEVEERELIHAPRHLKEDVFQRIDRQRERERGKRLISYRVKVLAGMAAALMVLLLLPIEGQNVPNGRERALVSDFDFPWSGETSDAEEWEQTALEKEREIDRMWERYQKKQERKMAGEQYLQEMKQNIANYFIWED